MMIMKTMKMTDALAKNDIAKRGDEKVFSARSDWRDALHAAAVQAREAYAAVRALMAEQEPVSVELRRRHAQRSRRTRVSTRAASRHSRSGCSPNRPRLPTHNGVHRLEMAGAGTCSKKGGNSGTDRPECQSKEGGGLEGGGCRNARETQAFRKTPVVRTA